eukprot:GHVR01034264.1.p1 GENE.GHVR01034264.1~~GHVR01034264.1.p1  ORF type:complete len:107 (+),score=31.64 GHVR01034264.1:242-562(+)
MCIVGQISELQRFDGSFGLSDRLAKIINININDIENISKEYSSYNSKNIQDIIATIFIIIFLEKKHNNNKSTWELFHEKANEWVKQQQGLNDHIIFNIKNKINNMF